VVIRLLSRTTRCKCLYSLQGAHLDMTVLPPESEKCARQDPKGDGAD
jgi:hypothetical protein